MNSPTTPSPTAILFAHERTTARLNEGDEMPVRVILAPARRRLDLFNLFESSKEAEVLEKTVQINHGTEDKTDWQPATPEWVDSLDEQSHQKLFEISTRLNFQKAVAAAEAVIAMGNELLPMQKRFAAVAIKPMKDELTSLISSLTAQFSAATPASAKLS